MTRLTAWGATLLLIATTVFVYAPQAHACSIAPVFAITAEHLAPSNFNAPDSQLAQDYRDWSGDESAEIQVLGVYVYETIHAVEADGDWSRGSVSVAVEMWGQWPADTSPQAVSPQDRSGEPPDNCGWGAAGRPLGTRTYSVITTADFADITIDDQDQPVLEAAFGPPVIADRDLSLEQDLIAQVDSARGSSTAMFVGIGLAALAAAGAVMYMSRRKPAID